MNYRRRLSLLATTGILMVLPLVAPTSASAAAGPSAPPSETQALLSFTTTGRSAQAFFTSYPQDRPADAGFTYSDTFVVISDKAKTRDGRRFENGFAFMRTRLYSVDETGQVQLQNSVTGYESDADVTWAPDPALQSATAFSIIRTQACDLPGCIPSGAYSLDVSWKGTGQINWVHRRYRESLNVFSVRGWQWGRSRAATAAGSADGNDLGFLVRSDIFHGTRTHRIVNRDNCRVRPSASAAAA